MDVRNFEHTQASEPQWRAAEFFAGIGLARLGMARAGIDVVWSNDVSETKQNLFHRYFPSSQSHIFRLGDLREVRHDELPASLDLAWASFPCTDLSVAGGRAGLHRGTASSAFWHFIKVLSKLGDSRPAVVALENVTAFAVSHQGRDIASAIRALNGLGYSVDVLRIDAIHFVPQSRPRLFLVGTQHPQPVAHAPDVVLRPKSLDRIFEDSSLKTHRATLPELPAALSTGLSDHLELVDDSDDRWWSEARVAAYEASLSPLQLSRYEELRFSSTVHYRTAYRRMRDGTPRWEMRSDGVAGCLRTSSGGSSKQALLKLGLGQARIRWMTPSEYASLMGVPDFPLDGVRDHHAYSGFGDAVCAPVVSWLAKHYLLPLLQQSLSRTETAHSECDAQAV